MEEISKEDKLPDTFRKYFWDVHFDQLHLEKHKTFILERLLNIGTFNTFHWIFSHFTNDEVKQILDKKGKHSFSEHSFYFWRKISDEKRLWKNRSN